MRPIRDASGFTLIELVFAMFLLALGLMGLATAFPAGSIAVTEGRQFTTAITVAQDAVERLKLLSYANIPVGSNISSNSIFAAPPPGYTRVVEVTEPDGGNMKKIRVSVTFNLSGAQTPASIETLITR